jgi:DNA-directed RNA polymerase subunit RPC12/RpoP
MKTKKHNQPEYLLKMADRYLQTNECPHCGKKIDSIIFGKDGIRCQFCISKNILEEFSFLSKIDSSAVKIQPLAGSVSEIGLETRDENGDVVDSAWMKVHFDNTIFDGDKEKFIKNYISSLLFVDRNLAYTFFPKLQPQKIKVDSSDKEVIN